MTKSDSKDIYNVTLKKMQFFQICLKKNVFVVVACFHRVVLISLCLAISLCCGSFVVLRLVSIVL